MWKSLLASLIMCAAFVSAAPALAEGQHGLRAPAVIAYMRYDQTGPVWLSNNDHRIWNQFAFRLGGVVKRVTPIQNSDILPGTAPAMDGGASALLALRASAARQGYDYVIVYAVDANKPAPVNEKAKSKKSVRKRLVGGVKWVFSTLTPRKKPPQTPVHGEAHLLDVRGGGPILSSWTEAPRRKKSWGILRKNTDVEVDMLAQLAKSLELQYQQRVSYAYARDSSIAD